MESKNYKIPMKKKLKKMSVNYHILANCNMSCKFCFSKFAESKEILGKPYYSIGNAKKLVYKLFKYGFSKITFVGGEPLLYPWLSELIKYTKNLGITTMIVTNASLLNKQWIDNNKSNIDWLSISIDSLDAGILSSIGRNSKGISLSSDQYKDICHFIKSKNIKLKINTVVCSKNKNEDLSDFLLEIRPERWKVFKVLRIEGQNSNMHDLEISNDEFKYFVNNHKFLKDHGISMIPEDNELMTGSYIMIDPAGRFFDNTSGYYVYSREIITVGVKEALNEIKFDHKTFEDRGGMYDW